MALSEEKKLELMQRRRELLQQKRSLLQERQATEQVIQRGGTISDERITVEEPGAGLGNVMADSMQQEETNVFERAGQRAREAFEEAGLERMEKGSESLVEAGRLAKEGDTLGALRETGEFALRGASAPFAAAFSGAGAALEPAADKAKESLVRLAAFSEGVDLSDDEIQQIKEDTSAIPTTLQPAVEKLQEEFQKLSPETQTNLVSALDLAGAFPLGRVAQLTKQPVKKGIATGTEAVKETGEQAITGTRRAAGATGEFLEERAQKGFREQAEDIVVPNLDDLTKRQREARFEDVVESPTGGRALQPNRQEQAAIDEMQRLLSEGKIKPADSTIKQGREVNKEISVLSKELDDQLKTTSSDSIDRTQLQNIFDEIRGDLSDNITIVGDAERSVEKLLAKVDQLAQDKTSLNASDLINIRREFDRFVRQQKGSKTLSPDTKNALGEAVRQVRTTLNNKAAELAQDVDVKQSLRRQSALFTAEGTLANRFAKESAGRLGRVLQNIQDRLGIPKSEIVEILGFLGLGASGVISASTLFPAIAGTILLQRGAKAAFSPRVKQAIGKLLKKIDNTKGSQQVKDELKDELNDIINTK